MNKKVSEISNTEYKQYNISSEPSKADIDAAIHECEFEVRGYQSHIDELNAEWNRSPNSYQLYCERMQEYHARRIAYFVVCKWTDPIVLHSDGRTIKDGLHRLKAAIHSGVVTVDVIIDGEV